ncbi:MAG: glycosyltransferase family 2 protein [bacterium]
MEEKKVLAVVLNYNGILFTGDLLFKALESLLKQDYKKTEIIVIDNHSTDESVRRIRKEFPQIRIIVLKKNTATMGYNAGIDVFLKEKHDYLLLCNNDIIFRNDFISSMVDFAERIPEAGLLTPRMMMLSDRNVYNSTGIIINLSGFAWDRNFGDTESGIGIPKSDEVIAGSGGAMFCRREAIEKTGKFDSIYRAYYEDVDLSVRMKRKTDLKIFYNSKAVCFHAFSKSWGKNPLKEFYMIRNRYIFVLTHFNWKLLSHSIRFMLFNVRHEDTKINRRIFFSLTILIPMIIFRRIKYTFYKPLDERELENFAGFPRLSIR